MTKIDRNMPEVVKALHAIEIDYLNGEGIDFEPYSEFMSESETNDWLQAWTGNKTADGTKYLIFGQDGTGGYAAFWIIRVGVNILEQPIVFFGSEGELGVVARNFSDYLWLLAGNAGPYEAIAYPGLARDENSAFVEFATAHSNSPRRSATEIVKDAQNEFPDFVNGIQQLCK